MERLQVVTAVAQSMTVLVSMVAIAYAVKSARRQNKISLSARRTKVLHLAVVVRDQLEKVWEKHQRQILQRQSIEEIATEWVEGLRQSKQLRRLIPKTEKAIWASVESLYEYLNPMLVDEFDDSEFYFEDIRVSQFLGQLADLFDELCAFASSSEGFPDKTMASFNHQELTNRINDILGQLKSVIKAMKSEMRF